jgi:predicted porin
MNKKSLLVLAVFAAFASTASAQSSVTVFGVLDQAVTRQSSGGEHLTSIASNQLNSNRLGFRGIEDLGNGLSATFWLEAAMSNENGQGAATGGGLSFNRQSYVSLISKQAGEVRLGRDYAPSFWNLAYFDVFGANGLGSSFNLIQTALGGMGSGATTDVRVNNAVGYFLPTNLGGVYGSVQGGLQEGAVTAASSNRYYGGRIGWAGHGFNVAAAYGDTKTSPTFASDYKVANVGVSYDFQLAKVYGLFTKYTFDPTTAMHNSSSTEELSVGIPIGLGAINASYSHTSGTVNGLSGSANQYSMQYVYNLSKRTALYVGGAQIANKDNADINFGDDMTSIPVAAGAHISAYNVGIRHVF